MTSFVDIYNTILMVRCFINRNDHTNHADESHCMHAAEHEVICMTIYIAISI